MTTDQYALIDFGGGRKLESLGGYLVDRPSPAAEGATRQNPSRWSSCDARYDARSRLWNFRTPWPASLEVDCGDFRMPVQPTPYGHIGLFPEQGDNWRWLIERGREGKRNRAGEPPWGLNLFGYTGASTLAMVSTGLAVAHVDAAKPNVQACRRAAERNHWENATIRFLVDDASKFVGRELRRGRRYRMIVLDPPAYGHAPGGRAWRLQRDLWPLLDQCLGLLEPEFALLITGHSPQVDQSDVSQFLRDHQKLQMAWRGAGLNLESGRSQLVDSIGRVLDAGFFVRLWS